MERATEILTINSIDQIPVFETIREISREKTLKLVFGKSIQNQRDAIGQKLKAELKGFQVGIHLFEPEINISKLITDKEIEDNQLFFEDCAKDYRKLSQELIYKLADKLKLIIDPQYPLLIFNPLKRDKRQIGKVGDWRYFLHGGHCGFENERTKQVIETPLTFGLEFGDLDPYFFTRFIKSTPAYKPLPVNIYEDYEDGVRINEVMLSLGKFEKINSNNDNGYGIVVADRDKVEVKIYRPEDRIEDKKGKFSLLRLFGLK